MQRTFDDILDECLDRVLFRGESVEACVADFPAHAAELREALETAAAVHGAYAFHPGQDRKRASRLRFLQAVDRRQRRQAAKVGRWLGRLTLGSRRWVTATAAVALLVVFGGTGTVLASDDSVPGDALYPVKRAAETTRLFFAFTDTQEVDVRARLLERRMEELESVTEKGRVGFVPELSRQIERHTQRVEVLTVASLDRVVAGVEATPTPPAHRGTVTPDRPPRREPAPEREETTVVRANRLLEINAQLDRTERRLRELSEHATDVETQHRLQQAQERVRVNLREVRAALERADAVHRGTDRPTTRPDAEPPPTDAAHPTPEPTVRVTVRLVAVDVVRVDGKVLINLTVLDPEGHRRVVHLSPETARLLKGLEQGSLRDLRIGSIVQLAVNPESGQVRAVRIEPEPSIERDEAR